jgi:hypothetical protein
VDQGAEAAVRPVQAARWRRRRPSGLGETRRAGPRAADTQAAARGEARVSRVAGG